MMRGIDISEFMITSLRENMIQDVPAAGTQKPLPVKRLQS
jgi:hypothetical protein